jgi:Outer membrane protein beta-barrel domain
MKRIFFLTWTTIFIISTNSLSQSINSGIKVGLNDATTGGSDASSQSITSFNAGIFATLDVAGLLDLQPELLYTLKGYKVTYPVALQIAPIPFGSGTVTAKISYMEIPVLLKLNTTSLGIIRPNIFAGPEIAFKLSSKAMSGSPSSEQDLQNINSVDYGIIIGAGIDIDLPITVFMIDIRYDIGLKDLNSTSNPPDIMNRVLSLNAGIAL